MELLHIELMFTRCSGVTIYWVGLTWYSGVITYPVDIVEVIHKEIMFTRYSGVNIYRVEP